MSDNPLDPGPDYEARLAERARHLWEADGKPAGREAEFRERADELLRMEMAGNSGQMSATRGEIVEEAEIQDNLGEIPGRLTDEGDRRQTPMTREQLREGE